MNNLMSVTNIFLTTLDMLITPCSARKNAVITIDTTTKRVLINIHYEPYFILLRNRKRIMGEAAPQGALVVL